MKIKDMIKKIDAYNEVAEILGRDTIKLHCTIGYGYEIPFDDFKSLKKNLNWHLIAPLAKAIIEFDGYELNKETEFKITDEWGTDIIEKVEFWA